MTGVAIINGTRGFYGPRNTDTSTAAAVSTFGEVEQLVLPIDVSKGLPTQSEVDSVIKTVPANALFLAAYLYLEEAFDSTSGTTTVNVGVLQPDGSAGNQDGFFTGLVANGATFSGWAVSAGALVGASLATPVQLAVVASVDDLTAGKGKLVVEYVKA